MSNDPGNTPSLGLYLPYEPPTAALKAFEYQELLQARVHVLSFYFAWGRAETGPDLSALESVLKSGFVPMITWEPWYLPNPARGLNPTDQPEYSLSRLLIGCYDEYIRKWATELKNLSSPAFFRPMHEMNGNWYPWCGTVNGNSPKEYADAWRRIRTLFREAGNDSLIWVWCPYAFSVPDSRDNEMERYFPGDESVDWLALDGYNWGTTREWSRWQSFNEVFEQAYRRLAGLSPHKPMMIAEVGCAEEGGDKSLWIREAMGDLREKLIRAKGLIWFNVDKECDWRIESSQESIRSFRQNWAAP